MNHQWTNEPLWCHSLLSVNRPRPLSPGPCVSSAQMCSLLHQSLPIDPGSCFSTHWSSAEHVKGCLVLIVRLYSSSVSYAPAAAFYLVCFVSLSILRFFYTQQMNLSFSWHEKEFQEQKQRRLSFLLKSGLKEPPESTTSPFSSKDSCLALKHAPTTERHRLVSKASCFPIKFLF